MKFYEKQVYDQIFTKWNQKRKIPLKILIGPVIGAVTTFETTVPTIKLGEIIFYILSITPTSSFVKFVASSRTL